MGWDKNFKSNFILDYFRETGSGMHHAVYLPAAVLHNFLDFSAGDFCECSPDI